jgi:hypothetical protein
MVNIYKTMEELRRDAHDCMKQAQMRQDAILEAIESLSVHLLHVQQQAWSQAQPPQRTAAGGQTEERAHAAAGGQLAKRAQAHATMDAPARPQGIASSERDGATGTMSIASATGDACANRLVHSAPPLEPAAGATAGIGPSASLVAAHGVSLSKRETSGPWRTVSLLKEQRRTEQPADAEDDGKREPDSVRDAINRACANRERILTERIRNSFDFKFVDPKQERRARDDANLVLSRGASNSVYAMVDDGTSIRLYPNRCALEASVAFRSYFDVAFDGAPGDADVHLSEVLRAAKLTSADGAYRVSERGKIRCR